MNATTTLEALLDVLATKVAERLNTPRAPERIPVAQAAEHGAPSPRWIEEQARKGRIHLRGPRGARFVDAGELAALLAGTTINRRRAPQATAGDVVSDARTAVAELAARRAAE